MPENADTAFLKVREVADVLGLTPETIRGAIKRGDLQGVRVGGVFLVRRSAIEGLLRGGTRPEASHTAAAR
jgi:excisionase family DNA binding protein